MVATINHQRSVARDPEITPRQRATGLFHHPKTATRHFCGPPLCAMATLIISLWPDDERVAVSGCSLAILLSRCRRKLKLISILNMELKSRVLDPILIISLQLQYAQVQVNYQNGFPLSPALIITYYSRYYYVYASLFARRFSPCNNSCSFVVAAATISRFEGAVVN